MSCPTHGLASGAFSCPGCGQLGILRGYGSERDVAVGDVLFADGDETYDLIVLLAGTADIIEGHGHPGGSVVASYGQSEFLGEIGMLTGQRAFLSAVATSAGRILAVPVAQLRRVMAQEPGLSDLILRTFLLRHAILMSRAIPAKHPSASGTEPAPAADQGNHQGVSLGRRSG
jgi:thioredoxin reductase (NADPH)